MEQKDDVNSGQRHKMGLSISPSASNIYASCTRTRLAPTPSGFLHLGNAFSFALTAAIAEKSGMKLLLRIDDLDQKRTKHDFVTDIFETLHFLEIPWNEGPVDASEFRSNFSQNKRVSLYNDLLDQLRKKDLLYACTCSRQQLAGETNRRCACSMKSVSLDAPQVNWRVKTGANPLKMRMGEGLRQYTLPPDMVDFIVRKKDGDASYQLSSLADDVYFGVDFIVRGSDLLHSSIAQLYLANLLGLETFTAVCFVHHPLLFKDNGNKLSKSSGDTSVRALRKKGMRSEDVYALIGQFCGEGTIKHWRELRTLDKHGI